MKPIILRDGAEHLGEIRNHESIFYGVDFGYPGFPKSYLIQSPKNRLWWL